MQFSFSFFDFSCSCAEKKNSKNETIATRSIRSCQPVPAWDFSFVDFIFSCSEGLCVKSWLIWDRYGSRWFVCSFLRQTKNQRFHSRIYVKKAGQKTIGNGDDANRSAPSKNFTLLAIKMAIKHLIRHCSQVLFSSSRCLFSFLLPFY